MSRINDPHLDPLRAPTRHGQHPHTLRSQDEVKNPQHMYERRDSLGAYHAQPQAISAPGQNAQDQKSILDNPLVMVGIGAAIFYGIAKLLGDSDAPRKNPAPSPAPSAPVFVMPSAIPVSTAPTSGPALQVGAPQAAPQPAQGAPKAKPKRKRKTTQARAADGTFRPAGTRKKAIVEGKEKKK